MSKIWQGITIEWKHPATWVNPLSRWLRPHLNSGGIRGLSGRGRLNLAEDDYEWMRIAETAFEGSFEAVQEQLAADLTRGHLRVFHGCRTDDATSYLQHGILRNDPRRLEEHLRMLVRTVEGLESYQDGLDERIAGFDVRERDTGQVYFALDDRELVRGCGHYLLYGSEWIQCVLGFGAHFAMRRWGAPTLLNVNIPMTDIHPSVIKELAANLLQEWARFKVDRPDKVAKVDFGFSLDRDVPPDWIAGHRHPKRVWCPFNGDTPYDSPRMTCRACEVQLAP